MNYRGIILILIAFLSLNTLATPTGLNFQARIKKPDGSNLEAPSVSFRFKYLNSAGTCTVYIEDFNNISMVSSAGNVNFALGGGSKVFPPSATALHETFSNNLANNMACSEGGSYAPLLSSEIRKVKVEFVYTGSGGLQTLNGIEINSVPYAMYATDAETLGGSPAALFTKFSDFTTCTGGDVLTYNGTAFSCVAPGGGSSQWTTNGADIHFNTGNVGIGTINPGTKLDVVGTIRGDQFHLGSDLGLFPVAAGQSTIQSFWGLKLVGNSFSTPQAYTASNTGLRDDFSVMIPNQNSAKIGLVVQGAAGQTGNLVQWQNDSGTPLGGISANGSIGLGTTTPAHKLDVVGDVNVTGNFKVNGVNISTGGGTVTAVTATPPLLSSGGSAPDISMPAATAAVDGYLSATDFTTFNNKVSSQWINNVTDIFFNTGNVGIGTNTPEVVGSFNYSGGSRVLNVTGAAQSVVNISAGDPIVSLYESDGVSDSRWHIIRNEGGRLQFVPHNDAGSSKGTALSILNSNGNVGIGTTAPDQKLDVMGNVRLVQSQNIAYGSNLLFQKDRAGAAVQNGDELSYTAWYGYDGTTYQRSSYMISAVDGTPAAGIVPGNFSIFTTDAAGVENNRLHIRSNGNIGMGTALPAYKLDVAGDVNVTGNFKINGVDISAGGGTVTGTGTSNAISKFTAAGVIGDSNISDNGTLVSISTDATVKGITIGRGTGNNGWSTAVGSGALVVNTTGERNTVQGQGALAANTTGNWNSAFGTESLRLNTTGSANAGVGDGSLYMNTTGSENAAMGDDALQQNTTGNNNTAAGQGALHDNTTGNNNSGFGYHAGNLITTGSNNVVIGSNDGGSIATTNNNIIISDGSGNIRQQINSSGLVGIGMTPSTYMLSVNGDVNIPAGSNFKINGVNVGAGTVSGSGTINNLAKFSATGTVADSNITDDGTLVAIATDATINGVRVGLGGGAINTNLVVGPANALSSNTTGYGNVAIGGVTLVNNTTGRGNMAIGAGALLANTTGEINVVVGGGSMIANTTGDRNTAIGGSTLVNVTTGSDNVAIGENVAPFLVTGSQNTFIGNNVNPGSDVSNTVIIGDGGGTIRYYTDSLGNTGIGTGAATPLAKLQVAGGAIMPSIGNSTTAGIQFPSDPGGGSGDYAFMRYYPVVSESTKLMIGVSNDADDTIGFAQFGAERMTISNGNVGIGTTGPVAKLDVAADNSVWGSGIQVSGGDAVNGVNILQMRNNGSQAWNLSQTGQTNISPNSLIFANLTGGTNVTFAGSGNVGIGNTNPAAALEVKSSYTSGSITDLTHNVSHAGILIDSDDIVNATHSGGVFWRTSNQEPTKPKMGIWMYQEDLPGSWMLFGTSDSYATGITNTAMAIDPKGMIGMGTSNPTAKLQINGSSGTTLKIVDGNQAAGRVLASDASGQASWQDPVNPRYSFITKSADFAVAANEHGNIFLVTTAANVTLPSAAAAGSGFHVMIKRMGASNVVMLTLPLDCPGGLTLSGNQSYAEFTSTGTDWILTNRSPSGTMCF